MFEIITQINDLIKRVGKLESLETPFKSYGLWANRPTAPFDGQRFFATDSTRRIEYEWDNSASNWLSTQLIPVPITLRADNTLANNTLTATRNNVLFAVHPDNSSALYVVNIVTSVVLPTAQSGTNFWTLAFRTRDNTSTTATTYSADTKLSTTAGRNFPITIAVNAVLARANFYDMLVDYTQSAAAGNLGFNPAVMWVRLIG